MTPHETIEFLRKGCRWCQSPLTCAFTDGEDPEIPADRQSTALYYACAAVTRVGHASGEIRETRTAACRIATLLAMVEWLMWDFDNWQGDSFVCCQQCYGHREDCRCNDCRRDGAKQGHKPDCTLAALIQDVRSDPPLAGQFKPDAQERPCPPE